MNNDESITFNDLGQWVNKWTIELENDVQQFDIQAIEVIWRDKKCLELREQLYDIFCMVHKCKNIEEQLQILLQIINEDQTDLSNWITKLEIKEQELQRRNPTDPLRSPMYASLPSLYNKITCLNEDSITLSRETADLFKSENCPASALIRDVNYLLRCLEWIESHISKMGEKMGYINFLKLKLQENCKNFLR